MARVNITIPDALNERLGRYRNLLNVSRTCALALEKEVEMLEGRMATTDPRARRLVQRIEGSRSIWYQRGRQDGGSWAAESATVEQLQSISDELATQTGEQIQALLRGGSKSIYGLPERAVIENCLAGWVSQDAGTVEQHPSILSAIAANLSARLNEVNEPAYLEGWRDGVKEVWHLARPALRAGSARS